MIKHDRPENKEMERGKTKWSDFFRPLNLPCILQDPQITFEADFDGFAVVCEVAEFEMCETRTALVKIADQAVRILRVCVETFERRDRDRDGK